MLTLTSLICQGMAHFTIEVTNSVDNSMPTVGLGMIGYQKKPGRRAL